MSGENNPAVAIPSAWSAYLPLVTSLIRTLLAAIGGFGVTWAATVSASDVQMISSAVLLVLSGVWSFAQKIQAMRALRAAAAAPAGVAVPKLPA